MTAGKLSIHSLQSRQFMEQQLASGQIAAGTLQNYNSAIGRF